ncbi:MAG: hypothetical protein LBJ78_00465 [Puniceicoccales bacterium]|nr:hypothetical protein [Puniceicoccales bacterium]
MKYVIFPWLIGVCFSNMCPGTSHPSYARAMPVQPFQPTETSLADNLADSFRSTSAPLVQQRSGRRNISPLMDGEMCQILAYLNNKAYDNSKRLAEGLYIFRNATSPASSWLSQVGVVSKEPFIGIHGVDENQEKDYPGFLAYRVQEKPGEGKHIDLFVTLRGSQGEDFQALGGYGGAS